MLRIRVRKQPERGVYSSIVLHSNVRYMRIAPGNDIARGASAVWPTTNTGHAVPQRSTDVLYILYTCTYNPKVLYIANI